MFNFAKRSKVQIIADIEGQARGAAAGMKVLIVARFDTPQGVFYRVAKRRTAAGWDGVLGLVPESNLRAV